MSNLIVTILAGGEGKRMNSSIPKSLIPFKGKPMLIRIINQARLLKPFKIIVVVGQNETQIKKSLENYSDIEFVRQPEPLGTGDAIKCVVSSIKLNPKHQMLILNGDVPLINKELILPFISKGNNSVLIAEVENPFGYGRIIINSYDNSFCIKEHRDCLPKELEVNKVNSGIYFFQVKNIIENIDKISNNNAQKEFYLTDLIEILNKEKIKIEYYLINKNYNFRIKGVNTIDELNELELLYDNSIPFAWEYRYI